MKVYVSTYGKYNSGSIDGKWLNLDDYKSKGEFITACRKLHSDEPFPEFMFQDYQYSKDNAWEESLYSEIQISAEYWRIKEYLKESNTDAEIFSAYVNCLDTYESKHLSTKDVDDCNELFIGCYESDDVFAESMAEEDDDYNNIPERYALHIDWEGIARDDKFNGEFMSSNGYYFRGIKYL